MDRISEHFNTITKKKNNTLVSIHFNTNKHEGLNDVKIYVLDFIHAKPDTAKGKYLLDKIELNWIHKLKTSAPLGLNTMDS